MNLGLHTGTHSIKCVLGDRFIRDKVINSIESCNLEECREAKFTVVCQQHNPTSRTDYGALDLSDW